MSISTITAADLMAMKARGGAHIVDVREPGEFESGRIAGAQSIPLGRLGSGEVAAPNGKMLVLVCASGRRSASGCELLARRSGSEAYTLAGGMSGWRAAGGAVEGQTRNVLAIDRQVQVVAGLLVLSGVVLGFSVHQAFFGLSGFVGAGLTFAGLSGFCGMAKLLAVAPWNRSRPGMKTS